jgi:hypothetical protein
MNIPGWCVCGRPYAFSVVPKFCLLSVYGHRLGIPRENFHLPLKFISRPEVIIVEKCDEFPASFRKPPVPCGCLAGVGLLEVPNATGIHERAKNCRSIVRRPVIDDNHLIIGESLREYRLQRRGDKIAMFVCGYYY